MRKQIVAITGVNGYIGSVLKEFLLKRDDIEKVIGLDIQDNSPEHDRYRYVKTDVRSKKLHSIFTDHRVTNLFHFAFILENISDKDLMYDINVNGTENVLHEAVAAGVKSIMVASSISVFGAWKSTSGPHSENDNPHPNEGDLYGLHKTIAEGVCEKYMAQYPSASIIIIRFSGVFGPHLQSKLLLSALKLPFAVLPCNSRGAFQIIHEEEAAQICYLAMKNGISGIYHAAGRETITMKGLYELLGKKYIRLPFRMLKLFAKTASKIKIAVTNTFQIELLRYPVLISGNKTFEKLGYSPCKSAFDIIKEFAEAHRIRLKTKK